LLFGTTFDAIEPWLFISKNIARWIDTAHATESAWCLSEASREQQEAIMGSNNLQKSEIDRCAVCGGKFGLVRYYTWRNAGLCSQRCRYRSKTREVDSLKWLFGMRSA
jgi:hypothetical protein